MNKTMYIGFAVWLILILSGVDAMSLERERLFNIPRGIAADRIGDIHKIRMPDGTMLELSRIIIKDGAVKDNIIGEAEVRFYDSAGKLQKGKGYIIINPAEGRRVNNSVEMPVTLKFIPSK